MRKPEDCEATDAARKSSLPAAEHAPPRIMRQGCGWPASYSPVVGLLLPLPERAPSQLRPFGWGGCSFHPPDDVPCNGLRRAASAALFFYSVPFSPLLLVSLN
jgi:hypothetical protein